MKEKEINEDKGGLDLTMILDLIRPLSEQNKGPNEY